MAYFHSVTLDKDRCHGCTNCIKRCPTEAIRVRDGKAKIIKERCIDCGECIRVCPYHAKLAACDSLDMLNNFKYNIALPAPSLYGQFGRDTTIDKILNGLVHIGFDSVYEVARGAEYVTECTKKLMQKQDIPKPVISCACPAVVRLIKVRFPNLIDNIIDLLSPMEVAAYNARKEAEMNAGLRPEDIGVFFITPCPAKVTAVKAPLSVERSAVSGAISVNDVFAKLYPIIKKIEPAPGLSKAGLGGVAWANSGGEAEGSGIKNYIAVDGIENVMKILEEVEDEKVSGIDFIELSACQGGCVGGVLNVVNSYIAKNNLKHLFEDMPKAAHSNIDADPSKYAWEKTIEFDQIMRLDEDLDVAMEKMEKMEKIFDSLPKLDCGSCGAPSCRALAEDIVRGFGDESFCIFKIKERVENLTNELHVLQHTAKKELRESKLKDGRSSCGEDKTE